MNSHKIISFLTVTDDQIDSRIVLYEATVRMEYGRCICRIWNAHLNAMAGHSYTNRSIQSDFDADALGMNREICYERNNSLVIFPLYYLLHVLLVGNMHNAVDQHFYMKKTIVDFRTGYFTFSRRQNVQ